MADERNLVDEEDAVKENSTKNRREKKKREKKEKKEKMGYWRSGRLQQSGGEMR